MGVVHMTSVFDFRLVIGQKQLRHCPDTGCTWLTQKCQMSRTQAGVLVMQYRHGPRWFVPRCFLPPKYDYHRPAPAAILPGGSQCDAPVCAPGQAAGSSGSGSDDGVQQPLVARSSSSSSGAVSRHGSGDTEKGGSASQA
jgi:hypothetical protein